MKNFSTIKAQSKSYLDHCITKNGKVSVDRLKKHVSFLEKYNIAPTKELNKYYKILDNYNKKQTNKKRKK